MSKPYFSLDLLEKVDFVAISPYEFSKNVICIAYKSHLSVSKIKFQEEYDDLEHEVELELLEDFHHRPRVQHIAWSPASSLYKLPNTLQLCAAGSDCSLRVFTTNLTNKRNTRKEIQGHNDYINGCCFDSEGQYLASVSDDLTCKLWSSNEEFELTATFNLTSPGMSVCWHPEQPNKLLVAEKCGILRVYSSLTLSPMTCVACSPAPLMLAEWPAGNFVVFIAAGILHKVDISVPGHMVEHKTVHPEGGYAVTACPANINYIATAGRPNNTLKITNIKTKIILMNTELTVFGGMAWHSRLPILCVADNKKLVFFKISPK